jgi:hypothetical protein
MDLQTQPLDDKSNGNVGSDEDESISSQVEESCLSQPSENGCDTDDG